MSNWQFMFLFPEEEDVLGNVEDDFFETVITGVREEVGLVRPKDKAVKDNLVLDNFQETMCQIRYEHPGIVRAICLEDLITYFRGGEDLNPGERVAHYNSVLGNLEKTMGQIRWAYPELVKAVLKYVTAEYNQSVDQAIAQFPLTVDAYWQNYRRNLTNASLIHGTDEEMANFYKGPIANAIKSGGGISLDVEPQHQLLDRQPQRALGLGVYIFKHETGILVETLWDLRQKETPRFHITNSK